MRRNRRKFFVLGNHGFAFPTDDEGPEGPEPSRHAGEITFSNAEVQAFQEHAGRSARAPMTVVNGFLTGKANRRNPSTDTDHYPREFRRFVNASGAQDVQINNGLQRHTAMGFRKPIAYADYLYASNPRIPGQHRRDVGGAHKRGIDPLNMQRLWDEGPGKQPKNPGGPGKIGADQFFNPGTS